MLPKVWPAVLTLGWILLIVAAGEATMALFSYAIGDGLADVFGESAAVTAGIGGACVLTTKGRAFELRFRDATLLTCVSWIMVPAVAALPLLADPTGLRFVDAYFEMVSGVTTTGSTVLAGLDTMPPTILLWRSTISWLGGMGIIGLALVILPFLNIGGMALFQLESSDRSENIMPGARGVAGVVFKVYLLLTAACFMTYWSLGMSPFDALNHAFTTVSTCGFSTHDLSFIWFNSPALEWAAVVFMAAGALPFLAYVRLVRRGGVRQRIDPQASAMIGFLSVVTIGFALWLVMFHGLSIGDALTKAAFNIVSIVTTTGYSSTDYLVWGAFAAGFFLTLTFVGGCTGSTAGGIKIFRFQVLGRVIHQHVLKAIYPNAVVPLRYAGRSLGGDEVGSVGTFVFLYLVTFAALACVLALLGYDAATSISATATAISNVGPGVTPAIGPVGNFASFSDSGKVVLSAAMILGRLEIMVVLLLFVPSFYR